LTELLPGYRLSATLVAQPSSCNCLHETLSEKMIECDFETRDLLSVFAWEPDSARGFGRIELRWFCIGGFWVQLGLWAYGTEDSSKEENMWGCVCCTVWGSRLEVLDWVSAESSWAERLCLLRCLIGNELARGRKYVVLGLFVNKSTSFKFCDQSSGSPWVQAVHVQEFPGCVQANARI
jgi:hypothetical protein